MDKDGNELDGECSRPQKHAKSPELAREFLLDAATVIFKEQACLQTCNMLAVLRHSSLENDNLFGTIFSHAISVCLNVNVMIIVWGKCGRLHKGKGCIKNVLGRRISIYMYICIYSWRDWLLLLGH